MASFVVDKSFVRFAGGRVGEEYIFITNGPANLGFTITGSASRYFRCEIIDSGSVKVSTTEVNNTSVYRSVTLTLYNEDNISDYVEVSLRQVNVNDGTPYIWLGDDRSSTSISNTVGSSMGNFEIMLDIYGGRGSTSTINTGSDWLNRTVLSTSSTGFIRYSIGYGTNVGSNRNGQITFGVSGGSGSVILYVTQEGGAVRELSVTPSSLSFDDSGGTSSIAVTYRGTTLSYNTSEVSDWVDLSLTDVITGTKSGVVTVAANTSTLQRTGSIWFSDTSGSISLPITQNGTIAPILSVTPSSLSFSAGGGTETIGVTYRGSLTHGSTPSWLSVLTSSESTGFNTYSVTAASNSGSARNTNITFTDNDTTVSLPISQASGEEQMSVTPSSLSFSASGGSNTVGVTYSSTGDLEINTSSFPSWLHITTVSVSAGYNVYTVSVDNNISSARNFNITFHDDNIGVTGTTVYLSVSQAASSVINITLNQYIDPAGNGSGSTSITVYYVDGGRVTVTNSSWIHCVSSFTLLGSDHYRFEYSLDNNSSESSRLREGYIRFVADNGTSCELKVYQGGYTYNGVTTIPDNIYFDDPDGGEEYLIVDYWGDNLTVSSWPSWVNAVAVEDLTHSPVVYKITAGTNYGGERSGSVTLSGTHGNSKTVSISQAGYTLSVSPSSWTTTSAPASITITVTHLNTVSYTGVPSWVTLTEISSGSTVNTYRVSVDENDTGSIRTANIVFTDSSGSVTFSVNQISGDRYTPIWRNITYYARPEDFPDDLAYKITVSDGDPVVWTAYEGYIPFLGVSATNRFINISRLVEDQFPNLTDFTHVITWGPWWISTIIVKIYQKGDPDVLLDTYYFIRDWSYYIQGYYTTKTLNDPINGHGCDNMTIPFFVFTMGDTSFSLVETSNSGSQSTRPLNTPIAPVCGGLNSFYGDKKVELNGNNNTFVSYDLTYCGSGNLVYRNRFGGYDAFLIEGNIEKKEDYTRDKYKSSTVDGTNIDRGLGGDQTLDVHIKTSYTAHTGWLTDDQAERLVFHLLSSPDIYFQSFEGYRYGERHADFNLSKVIITDSSAVYKKFKNGKRMVSYAITFELSDTKKIVY